MPAGASLKSPSPEVTSTTLLGPCPLSKQSLSDGLVLGGVGHLIAFPDFATILTRVNLEIATGANILSTPSGNIKFGRRLTKRPAVSAKTGLISHRPDDRTRNTKFPV